LERKFNELKVKQDFSNFIYRIEVPKEGEYEIIINNNGEKKNLGEKYFKKGVQEFVLPNNRNLIDKNLQAQRILQSNLILKSIKNKNSDFEAQVPMITFLKINPTKYRIKVEGAKEPYTLIFSESFHKGWKAYINQNQSSKTKNQNYYWEEIINYFDGDIKEITSKSIFLDRNIFETVGKKQISEERHFLVNGYANSWYITPGDVNGEQDYELIIEFWPQRLFYIGLGISGLTLIICLFYLFIKKWKKI